MGAPTSGNDYLVYVDTADADSTSDARTYVLISGQVNGSDNRSLETADSTDKDSSNWKESVATNRAGETSVECVREEGDTGQDKVRSVQKNRRKHFFKVITAAGNESEAQYFVKENNTDMPQDDTATWNFTLESSGEIVDS